MMPPRRAAIPLAILLAAIVPLSLVAAGGSVLPGDVAIAGWLQAHPAPLTGPLTDLANDVGAGRPLTLAGAALAAGLLLGRHPRPALLIALATAVRSGNGLLKATFDSPRPAPELIAVTERAAGLGFPSGHAMGATLVFGAMAWLLATGGAGGDAERTRGAVPWVRRLGVVGCVGVILLTGYARVMVGAHWPSDVLGGYLWGSLLLAIAVGVVTRLTAGSGGQRPP